MSLNSYIHEQIDKLKEAEEKILDYLDEDQENDLELLYQNFDFKKIKENKYLLKDTLYILSHISNNHHRYADFFAKIETILNEFKFEIQKYFSSLDIYRIFEKNKRILLFLFEEEFIKKENSILLIIQRKSKDFAQYLFPSQNNGMYQEIFDKKRKIGENDTYICDLIRNDYIDEFIVYSNQTNLPLNSKIKSSIFETNPIFLIQEKEKNFVNDEKDNNPTLIEYAAFFGSIQIFQYLRMNNVKLTPSLWKYAVHSNNAELIHLLEELHIKPKDINKDCLIESIKCHHLNLMNYFDENYVSDHFFFIKGLHYYNFSYLCNHPFEISESFRTIYINKYKSINLINDDYLIPFDLMIYGCVKYDYYNIVSFLFKRIEDINQILIYKLLNTILKFDLNYIFDLCY